MIDMIILFFIFYFLLYTKAYKKYGNDPKKSLVLRLFGRKEGTWFDSLFEDKKKKQIPIFKCILTSVFVRVIIFYPAFSYIEDVARKDLEYSYSNVDKYKYVTQMLVNCNLCAPIGLPILKYLDEQKELSADEVVEH